MNSRNNTCKKTRKIAADSLHIVLKQVLENEKPISESDFRDKWLFELRKHTDILSNGWYEPPPHGIGVIFAIEANISRANFPTLRTKDYWPKNNIFLDRSIGFITVYCSPVDKKSGIIGDFGLSIYFGKNKKIQKHMKTVFTINKEIFNCVHVGMPLKELYKKADSIIKKRNYTNSGWISISDPEKINMGHTIPKLPAKWDRKDIGEKRLFFNAKEEIKIIENMAFTIEPRLKNNNSNDLPTVFFHTICLIRENGTKELLTGFDDIFRLAGMDYMLRI